MEEKTKWMQRACELAEAAAARDEVPVGAVLVHDNVLLAEGSNIREASQRTTGHAEMVALEAFNQKFSSWRVPAGTALYVTAEPCLMCAGALLWARVDLIYYGCSDTKNAGLRRVTPLIEAGVFDHRFRGIESGVEEKRCASLLSGYFSQKRKIQRELNAVETLDGTNPNEVL
jgi:tRNA(adenine34) deaminase